MAKQKWTKVAVVPELREGGAVTARTVNSTALVFIIPIDPITVLVASLGSCPRTYDELFVPEVGAI